MGNQILESRTLQKFTNGFNNLYLGIGRQRSTYDKNCLGHKPKSKVNTVSHNRVQFNYDKKSQEPFRTRIDKKISREVIPNEYIDETTKYKILQRIYRILRKVSKKFILREYPNKPKWD